MSQFDQYTTPYYVESLRKFLNMNKRGFLKAAGFVKEDSPRRIGRLPGYDAEAIQRLEDQANAKAALAESSLTNFGQRYAIARDYKGYTDTMIAEHMGVSRELVRQWALDTYRPKDMAKLAAFLDVPLGWLEKGGATDLLASSHIGVRVGTEVKAYKEALYAKTMALFEKMPASVKAGDEGYLQTYLEVAVNADKELRTLARRAGGRWQIVKGQLQFAPWQPIAPHKKIKSAWSKKVESWIQEELETKPTVTEAWKSLEKRALEAGLKPNQFPKKISLHKRVEAERNRVERFGVDINDMVRRSVDTHIHRFFN